MQYFKRRFKLKRFVVFVTLTVGLSLLFVLRAQTPEINVIDTISIDTLTKTNPQAVFGTGIANNHVWRGVLLDETKVPHIQPFVSVVFGGAEIGIMGSYNVFGSYFETDIYASYKVGAFCLTVTDFYIMGNVLYDYFDYENNHHIVGDVIFGGTSKIPIQLTASTVLNSSWDTDVFGKNKWTTFFEIRYFKNEWDFFVGALTNGSDFYLNGDQDYGFNVINLGFSHNSSLSIGDTKCVPLTTQFCVNPQKQRAYLTILVTF